jgi:hypothetical protein
MIGTSCWDANDSGGGMSGGCLCCGGLRCSGCGSVGVGGCSRRAGSDRDSGRSGSNDFKVHQTVRAASVEF